jgi:hypothetical protein
MTATREHVGTVRLFGLAGVALQTELSAIEQEFGITLHAQSRSQPSESNDIYYPQFEENVRKEASSMARHYEIFYCLEKTIRQLIEQRLEEVGGINWWAQKVPPILAKEVGERMQRDVDSAVTLRSTKPIDFTTFGELGEIIKANWDIFGDTFNSQKAVEKVMANLNTLRGPIAHCSPLAPDEVIRLQLSLRDWFRLME